MQSLGIIAIAALVVAAVLAIVM
uniref:Vpu protein n=1 Tax=Human immunodeficiency virus type 1 TaxID=11676 RepID=B5ADJ5_HV1|nr:vpu protein [Human immunodeficiency virus 1]